MVRRAGALGSVPGLRLIVMADFTRQEGVDDAVRGQDVVISSLGSSSGPTSVCTDGIRAILAAMSRTGTRRLIVVSAYGAAETHDRSLYSRVLWARLSAKMRDKEAMERLIRASDTDWTVVRPPALKDKPLTGSYRTGTDVRIRLTSSIPRADLADFMLREATSPSYVGAFPRIAA